MPIITPAAKVEVPSTTTTALSWKTAGEAIALNDFCYFDDTDKTIKKAINDTEDESKGKYIAQAAAAIGNAVPVLALRGGQILIFGSGELTVGETYAISDSAGKLEEGSALVTGEYLYQVGTCIQSTPTSTLVLHPEYVGLVP